MDLKEGYSFLELNESLCSKCLKKVPAKVVEQAGIYHMPHSPDKLSCAYLSNLSCHQLVF